MKSILLILCGFAEKAAMQLRETEKKSMAIQWRVSKMGRNTTRVMIWRRQSLLTAYWTTARGKTCAHLMRARCRINECTFHHAKLVNRHVHEQLTVLCFFVLLQSVSNIQNAVGWTGKGKLTQAYDDWTYSVGGTLTSETLYYIILHIVTLYCTFPGYDVRCMQDCMKVL